MLYDTVVKKQTCGISVVRIILEEGRKEGEIWNFCASFQYQDSPSHLIFEN
jgi:hypothetical protein